MNMYAKCSGYSLEIISTVTLRILSYLIKYIYFQALNDFIKKRTVQLAELKEIFLNLKEGGTLSDSSSER